MGTLLVAATAMEIGSLSRTLAAVDTIQTGIGMINTAYVLTKALCRKSYDLVLNIGVCGSYTDSLKVGTVVEVTQEILGDLGATTADGEFLDLQELGFPLFEKPSGVVFNTLSNPTRIRDVFPTADFPQVQGLTLNTTTGDQNRIAHLQRLFDADIETMEGAAVALVCQREGIPYLELRAVSNKVEPRNKSHWNIGDAINNLHVAVGRLFEKR